MSDLPAEGSAQNPYRENPPTHFREVHWGGSMAVQWKEGQFLYIERDVANLADSGKGVCSFWMKVLRTKYGGLVGTNMLDNGYGGFIQYTLGDLGADYTDLGHRWISRAGIDVAASLEYTALEVMTALNRWYHVYIEWDTSGLGQRIAVNGRTVAADDTRVEGAGPPFVNGWKTKPSDIEIATRGAHTHIVFMWAYNWLVGTPAYSVAEFWLDVDVFGLGPDKFVDVAKGVPKSLGARGELPKTLPPDPLTGVAPPPQPPKFYFARRGEPATFLLNRGSAGDVKLSVGYALPVIPPEDGPIHEPEAPHFMPPPPPPAAAD